MSGRLPAAILWDFDGTLVETESMWEAVERSVARELGRDLPEGYHAGTIGGTVASTAALIKSVTESPLDVARIEAELWSRARAGLRAGPIPWMPGVEGLLRSVEAAGIPQALVSSGHREYLRIILDRLDPSPFAVVVSGDEVDHNKPHPEPYLRAMDALLVSAAECLVVEDSHTGCASGMAAGCAVLAVPTIHAMEDAPGLVVLPTLEGATLAGLSELYARATGNR